MKTEPDYNQPFDEDNGCYPPKQVGASEDSRPAPCSPKIIQLLLTPNDTSGKGMLLGLGDDGITYRADLVDGWVEWIAPLSRTNATREPHRDES